MGKEKKKYDVKVDYTRCKKCGICIAFCPVAVFTQDKFGAPIVSFPDKCINCKLCVLRCPDFAVEVSLREEKNHRKQKQAKD